MSRGSIYTVRRGSIYIQGVERVYIYTVSRGSIYTVIYGMVYNVYGVDERMVRVLYVYPEIEGWLGFSMYTLR